MLGKRKSFRDQEASFLFAKTSKAVEIQHNSVRYTPAHRVEDGVRIIDVDNLPPNLVETNSNTDENSFMTFEKLMDEIETSYSGPDCPTNCGMNQRSVIQKVVSPLPLVNKNLLAGVNGGEEQQRLRFKQTFMKIEVLQSLLLLASQFHVYLPRVNYANLTA